MTTRTKFCCAAAIPNLAFTVSASGKVTHKGAQVLTTSAKLSGTGNCQILTTMAQGVLQPCQFQKPIWQNPDYKHKANGESLLTDGSFCNCPICPGQMVKVSRALSRGFKSGMFSAASAISLENLSLESSAETPKAPEKISAQKISNQSFLQEPQSTQGNKTVATKDAAETLTDAKAAEQYTLSCPECDKKNCKYRLEKFGEVSNTVDNDSAQLKRNYESSLETKKFFDAADKAYKNSLELLGSWSYAAHHIISGNQVFKQVPEVVRLAGLCNYDINCAENCIMLPSKREGHGNLNDLSKSASAFDVMSITAMQWHVGKHSYSFDETQIQEIKKQIARLTGKPGKIKTYAELLIEELKKIKFATGEKICPAQFIVRMNKISEKVRNKLAAFSEKPAASYPYYVSKEAYLFAFQMPRLRKFIYVEKAGQDFNLKLYKTVGSGNDVALQKSLSSDDAVEIIKFCGNVQHFVFQENLQVEKFTFEPEFFRSVSEFNFSEVAEIIVWLRANPAENYVAPARKIVERLEKLK